MWSIGLSPEHLGAQRIRCCVVRISFACTAAKFFELGMPHSSIAYSQPDMLQSRFCCAAAPARLRHSPLIRALIPKGIDQNPCAHCRGPMVMMRQGWSTSLFQAWQQCSTMSS